MSACRYTLCIPFDSCCPIKNILIRNNIVSLGIILEGTFFLHVMCMQHFPLFPNWYCCENTRIVCVSLRGLDSFFFVKKNSTIPYNYTHTSGKALISSFPSINFPFRIIEYFFQLIYLNLMQILHRHLVSVKYGTVIFHPFEIYTKMIAWLNCDFYPLL